MDAATLAGLAALPFLVLAPGYAWLRLLFPARPRVERVAMAVPLSLAIVTGALFLALQLPSVRLSPLLVWATAGVLTGIPLLVARARRAQSPRLG